MVHIMISECALKMPWSGPTILEDREGHGPHPPNLPPPNFFCVGKRKKGKKGKKKDFQSRNYEKAVTKVKMLLF